MPFLLLAIIAIIIGVATIAGSITDTQSVIENIYDATWMKVLWGVMVIASIWQIAKRKLWSRLSVFLLHASFLIILAGALLTSLFAEKGNMYLRESVAESAFIDKESKVVRLPFIIKLDSFIIERHPGTDVPSDYISHISIQSTDGKETVSGKISMNNILKHKGYRFYLTSFDEDGKGAWFIVNHDPWGIGTTYTGYALLALSTILILIKRGGKLRSLLRHPLLRKTAFALLLTLSIQGAYASTDLTGTGTITAEQLHDTIPFSKILFILNLSAGLLTLAINLYRPSVSHRIRIASRSLLFLSTALLLFAFCLRWYIGERIPLSNGYETMMALSLATLIIACFIHRRIAIATPFALIISGFTLLVSHLAQMNPQITPLMPVLQSPLLCIHVAVIMISYALFAFMTLNAITSLVIMRKPSQQEQAQRLTLITRIMLYPATLLLAAGIFIGAVWANVSWGCYWSWDPKEVWALVTMIVYGIAFHDTSIPWLRKDKSFNIYIALAFLTLLMTYFGVNYLLGGMHSYAN